MRRSALQCSCAVHKERVHPPLSASVADVNLGVYLSHTPSLRPEVAHGRVQNPPKQGYPVRDGHLTYIRVLDPAIPETRSPQNFSFPQINKFSFTLSQLGNFLLLTFRTISTAMWPLGLVFAELQLWGGEGRL